MPQYADIYALGSERNPEAIAVFLDRFLPESEESADEYEVPQYSDEPRVVFATAAELIEYCCEHPAESHAIYWRNSSSDYHAMVFFLSDGGIIFGVSTPSQNIVSIDNVSAEMVQFFGQCQVVVTYEDLPPDSKLGFREFVAGLPRVPEDVSVKEARRNRAHRPILGEQDAAPQIRPR